MKKSKDHYVPEFYLKRRLQNNPDRKLFSVRYFPMANKLQRTGHARSGTGFERGLYEKIETTFFQLLDSDASNILNRLESKNAVSPVKLAIGRLHNLLEDGKVNRCSSGYH